MQGKPHAGNPHVWFDEGAGAPRHSGRPALLYKTTNKKWGGIGAIALVAAVAAASLAPISARAEEAPYSFFLYDEETALHGYASYDAWREHKDSEMSSASASTETISEAGHLTWSVSSGIDLITIALIRGFKIILF